MLTAHCHILEQNERMTVVSVGRDEVIRFWDAFLSVDWIGKLLNSRSLTYRH